MIRPISYYFPFCALAARYKDDSGDGDQDTTDFIDDAIAAWVPNATVRKYKTRLDLAFLVTVGDLAIVTIRGTEGAAWLSNFDPFPFSDHDAHDGFYNSGIELWDRMRSDLLSLRTVVITGQSRGGALAPVVAELMFDELGVRPYVITYSAPPVYNKRGRKRFNATGIEGIRVVNPRDIVDNAGRPILKHVLNRVQLPYVSNFLNNIPFIGWLIGGHAYTSIFDGLIAYAIRSKAYEDVGYLRNKKGYCSI